MKYRETGFRAVYKHMCVFPMCSAVKDAVKSFPGCEKANCVLVYGSIDREVGLTLEVLAAGFNDGTGCVFFDGNDTVMSKIRIGAVQNEQFGIIDDDELKLQYSAKIAMLEHYAASEDVEKTREMAYLDSCRDAACIDDILVILTKEGLQPEGVWVRLSGLGGSCVLGGGSIAEPQRIHALKGKLLNDPYQDFGHHVGEEICLLAVESGDNKTACYSDAKLLNDFEILFQV